MLNFIVVLLVLIALLTGATLITQLKGLEVIMLEKDTLDKIQGFVTDTLTPYVQTLIANQKDPADQAEAEARREEETQILTALQTLVPAAPDPNGQTAIPTDASTTGDAG